MQFSTSNGVTNAVFNTDGTAFYGEATIISSNNINNLYDCIYKYAKEITYCKVDMILY